MIRLARPLALATLLLSIGSSLLAVVQPDHETALVPLDRLTIKPGVASALDFKQSVAWRRFEQQAGFDWRVSMDGAAGRPAVVRGALPWVPGVGNRLERGTTLEMQFAAEPVAVLDQLAREFVTSYPEFFGASSKDLRLNPAKTGPVLGGQLWWLAYDYAPHGILVEHAEVFFRVHSGNLIQFGSNHLLAADALDPQPRVAIEIAEARAASLVGPGTVPQDPEPVLVWVPSEVEGRLAYKLAWKFGLKQPGEIPNWRAWVDAHSGEVIGLEDRNEYLCTPEALAIGRVTGGVKPMLFGQEEVVRPLPQVYVASTDGTKIANDMGLWSHPGGAASARLAGDFGAVNCVGCQNPPQPFAQAEPTGEISFGTGGDNHIGNGLSTLAGRTTYYHVGRSVLMGRAWLPGLQFFNDPGFGMNVNINATCNAFFNGTSINMFRRGGNCNNTGEIPGVIVHEWGHGLDMATGGSVDGRGEGLADHVAWLSSHDPRVGPGFSIGGGPVRNVDESVVGTRVYPNQPNCGGSVHCQGQWWGQAGWHFTQSLIGLYGEQTGFRIYEALFFQQLRGSNRLDPNSGTGIYEAMAAVLAANGNPNDGLYFGTMFNEAFQHHGMAPASVYPDAGLPCDPAPTGILPSIEVQAGAETGRPEAVLTWTATPDTVRYEILRNQLGLGENLLKLGETTDTTFTDTALVQGDTYQYVVLPVSSIASPLCIAEVTDTVQVDVDLVQVGLVEFAMEGPEGDDGVWLPGETIEIRPTFRNASGDLNPPGAPATGVTSTLSSDDFEPQISSDFVSIGDMDPGETVISNETWTVGMLDDPDLCGETMTFRTAIDAEEGCWDSAFSIVIGEGDAEVVVDTVVVDDTGPLGNANGFLEPGETGELRIVLRNRGTVPARNVSLSLEKFNPRVTITPETLFYGDIAANGSKVPEDSFQVEIATNMPCDIPIDLFLTTLSDDGCWRDNFRFQVVSREVLISESFERPTAEWQVSGGAADGAWVQTNPTGSGAQPDDDTTPTPGILAWVTGNVNGGPADGDVDGGCTVLTSPVFNMGGTSGITLEYQRFYTIDGVEDDSFLVEISNTGGGNWQELERITRTEDWSNEVFDLDTVFGGAAEDVRIRFTACDQGTETIVEAGVDDVVFSFRGCAQDPSPRPELEVAQWLLDDGISGGSGDADGIAEPGEELEIVVVLKNTRNDEALQVSGTLSLESPVPGVTLVRDFANWEDIPAGAARGNDAEPFLLQLDGAALACGDSIPLVLTVDYADMLPPPDNSLVPLVLTVGEQISVGILQPGSGGEIPLMTDDFESGPSGWIHADVRTKDDWTLGTPMGLQGDPDTAFSGDNVWGNDLGELAQGQPVGGAYEHNMTNFLETWPMDASLLGSLRMEFQRWLTLDASDEARILAGDQVVWEAPSGGVTDTEWSLQDLDLSVADGHPELTIRFEISSDAADNAGGWNIDDIAVYGVVSEPLCNIGSCDNTTAPDPVRADLRVAWEDRAGGTLQVEWPGYEGNALNFRLYQADDPTLLPPAVDLTPTDVTGRGSSVADTGDRLLFFEVTAVNPCGVEELQ